MPQRSAERTSNPLERTYGTGTEGYSMTGPWSCAIAGEHAKMPKCSIQLTPESLHKSL